MPGICPLHPSARLGLVVLALWAPTLRAAEPEIAPKLQPFVDRGVLAGAVTLVASPDAVLKLEAVGYSDVGAKVPLRTDALFWIASMNKPITASALMILVDERKVKLDDPVATYLPEFRNQMIEVERSGDLAVLRKPKRPVTVRDILSHTAGLVGRSPLEGKLDSVPIRDGAISYGLSPLKFEPGSKYEYCNPGINTVGRIVEVASGMPYEAFLRTRLLEPLGMKDTVFVPDDAQVARLARSYRPDASKSGLQECPIEQLTYPLTAPGRHPYPAGGLFSTATDLAAFCRMILRGGELDGRRYLSEASVRAMTSTQTGDLLNGGKGENGYGLGWSTSRKAPSDPGTVIPGPAGHGGAYATHMEVDPDRKLVSIFLVQHAGFPGDGNQAHPTFQKAVREAYGK